MSAYGATPIPETVGTSLGIGYVRVTTSNLGAVGDREYWNHSLLAWEPGPRVDAKHVVPHQRLSDDPADVDNGVQLATVPRLVMESSGVVMIVYNIDQTGKATGVYTTYGHNIASSLAAINGITY